MKKAIGIDLGGTKINGGLINSEGEILKRVEMETSKEGPIEASASIMVLQNGEVQGVVLSDQFAEKFVNDGTLKIIRSLTFDEDFKTEPCCVYATNRDFLFLLHVVLQ